jgi:DNA-directed RNA polymerase beta subunit
VRIGNPALIGNWKDLKPGLDYSKLDERGIVKEGEYVDENTVIVGAYMMSTVGGTINDASKTPQVWTRGRVEKVVVMVNNMGLRLVKIRVVQDRMPELGDKFSNRHGQKGTIGAMLRGYDMPRTESGLIPDMIMNPHAIPSRMTIAQNLEQLMGKTAALSGAIGDGTSFMNDGSPQEAIGGILEELGFEKYGNEVMYNGATGEQIPAAIFIGPVYGMRLKHMVEDKWNARGKGKKEVRTHQPTGGRGAQGGLKIGEMDRDAIIAHRGMSFVKESFMERSDGAKFPICVACGTIPIYNPRLGIAICSLCDGPVK